MFIGVYTFPVLVTYLGLLCSFLTCVFALSGNFKYSVILFTLAGVFDLFDGLVARKMNKTEKENIFGVQIDSIIDVFSFGVTPIILAVALGMNSSFDFAIMFMYVCAATMRLAYFNYLVIAKGDTKPVKFYSGLPVTSIAAIFPVAILFRGILDADTFILVIRSLFILVTILFITNIKIPKPRGLAYVIIPVLMCVYFVLAFIML